MEYVQIVFGVIVYIVVFRIEWAAAVRGNVRAPFVHAAFWPLWLAAYAMILIVMAAIAAAWLVFTLFSEILGAVKQSHRR